MAKRKISGIINAEQHPLDMSVQWNQEQPDGTFHAYSGDDIEAFLKSVLRSKTGHIEKPLPKGDDGYFHIRMFADAASQVEYYSDVEANAHLLLQDIPIPILEDKGASDVVTLTRESPASIAVSKKEASVTVTYLWQQYNPITQVTTPMDESATITVSVRMQNSGGQWGAWDTSKQFTVPINSGQTKTIDVSSLLTSDGTYQVRLVAVGETSGIQAAPATVQILYSNVSLSYEGEVSTVYRGAGFQLPFRISGSTNKRLCIKMNNRTKQLNIGTTPYVESLYQAACTMSDFALVRGVANVEAWIAFGDGFAYETERVEFQIIYIPEGDTATSPILAVTEVQHEFQNWTKKTVFKYAVYNPSANVTPIVITLADRTTNEVYLVDSVECANGETYEYDKNFAIEPNVENVPTTILAQFQFTNAQNVSFGNNINVEIDNTENFSATKGATFILSPEQRSIAAGSQSWQLEDVISDSIDTNSGWKQSLETDSAGVEVSIPVLTVAAGNRVEIPYNVFDSNTGHNQAGVEGSTTIEFDMRVSNITGDDAVVDMSVPYVDEFCGVKIFPTRAICLSRANNAPSLCDVGFQEDEREHIAINIIRNLRNEGINYVRIFLNGKCNREFVYADDDAFVPLSGQGSGRIAIGSDSADIDIFGIRIYKGVQLGSTQIQNDYMANMPTIEDKKKFKQFNSIFNGSEIEYEACLNMGYNCILRKIPAGGHYPNFHQPDKQKNVEVKVDIFGEVGNPDSKDMKHSGTFYNMTGKGQGTSAKGYYWWNITDGFEDPEEITEAQYDASNPTHYYEGDGEDRVYYKMKSWFCSADGTSQMYVQKYEIENGRGGITKLNGKANYASIQQSHKLGNIWMYDELWQRLVNNGSGNRPILDGHAACYEKPFLAFYQIGEETPRFCGFQTWGSAKGDKKTFGFDKKKSPGYMCVSGADNGAVAALFQIPIMMTQKPNGLWEGNLEYRKVTINTGDEKNGYCYKDGNSPVLSFEVEIANKYDGGEEKPDNTTRGEDELKGASETTFMVDFAKFTQFVCASSPLLKPFDGTVEELVAQSQNLETDHQYWISANNSDKYRVFYYNPANRRYEQLDFIPTAWGADGRHTAMGSMLITTQLAGLEIPVKTVSGTVLTTLEDAMGNTSSVDEINEYLSLARVEYFKIHAASYIDIPDIVFHQCWVKLEAATDNRTKNTYPWIDGTIDKLVRWKQDDMDTVKNTDNQGQLTKPYYILEHMKDENGKNYWNGENNVFFTLVERAYPDRMRSMMKDMFAAMASISGDVFQYYHDRFFWVQEYFPAVAYNETIRLLYEAAKVIYDNATGKKYSQDPITQAIGDQLESEMQYVKQRLPMLMSWCEYENYEGGGSLSFRSFTPTYGGNPTYNMEFTAYQYIYPKLVIGGSVATIYARKNNEWVEQEYPYLCAPDETVRMVITTESNTQLNLQWLNYCKSLGNLGTQPAMEEGAVAISGKRLRSLEIWSEDGVANEFRPRGGINLNCRNLESVNLTNANFSGTFSANLPRCQSLKLGGTNYNIVNVPKTSALTELVTPASIQKLEISAQPNLEDLLMEGMANLQIFSIEGRHKLSTYNLANQLYEANPANLLSVAISGIDWEACRHDMLMWLCGKNASLQGRISMVNVSSGDKYISFNEKLELIRLYGDIDSDNGDGLYVNYQKRPLQRIGINGLFHLPAVGDYRMTVQPVPETGNNVKIVNGKAAIRWTLQAQRYGTLTDDYDCNIHVSELSDPLLENRYELVLEVVTVNINTGVDEVMRITRQIGFYRRIPKLGDFVYADGTFDNQWHDHPELVGVVFMRIPLDAQGRQTSDPNAVRAYDVRICALSNVTLPAPINATSLRFGLYPDNTGVNGFTNISGAGDASMEQAIKNETGLSAVYDIPDLPNVTDYKLYKKDGTKWGYIAQDPDNPDWDTYLDPTQDDGYRVLDTSNNSVIDYDGKSKNEAALRHVATIIQDYMKYPMPTNLAEMAAEMMEWRTQNGGSSLYDEFFYPAVLACSLWEPSVTSELCDDFKKGKWRLPAEGELSRIYNFKRHGTAISDANENAESEAVTPIFANANARAGRVVISFTESWYWSISEGSAYSSWYVYLTSGLVNYTYGYGKCNSVCVRAVAALTFEL